VSLTGSFFMNRIIVNAVALPVLAIGLSACADTAAPGQSATAPGHQTAMSAANPRTPGATGTMIIPGDTSTIAGGRGATRTQQTDPFVPSN
jgi:hypothetical protein